jgi:hypothetical protein
VERDHFFKDHHQIGSTKTETMNIGDSLDWMVEPITQQVLPGHGEVGVVELLHGGSSWDSFKESSLCNLSPQSTVDSTRPPIAQIPPELLLDPHQRQSMDLPPNFPERSQPCRLQGSNESLEKKMNLKPTDILLGQSSFSLNNIGNRAYRVLIVLGSEQYMNLLTQKEKTEFFELIVLSIVRQEGRFLMEQKGGGWTKVGFTKAKERVAYSFRDQKKKALHDTKIFALNRKHYKSANDFDWEGIVKGIVNSVEDESFVSPQNEIIHTPSPLDVLLGMDKENYNHIGNIALRALMSHSREQFNLTSGQKTATGKLYKEVVRRIRIHGGKFLEELKGAGWKQVGLQKAKERIRNSLRHNPKTPELLANMTSTSICFKSVNDFDWKSMVGILECKQFTAKEDEMERPFLGLKRDTGPFVEFGVWLQAPDDRSCSPSDDETSHYQDIRPHHGTSDSLFPLTALLEQVHTQEDRDRSDSPSVMSSSDQERLTEEGHQANRPDSPLTNFLFKIAQDVCKEGSASDNCDWK